MGKGAKRFLARISTLSNLWTFLPAAWQTAIVAAISAVTGYFGFEQGGIFWALIGGSAVFAFGMLSLLIWIILNRTLSVFERLTVDQVGISQVTLKEKKDGRNRKRHFLSALTLNCTLRNHSQQTIYFKIKRASHSMGGQTVPPSLANPDHINIVPPKTGQKINFATLPDVELKDDLKGHIDLEIQYGPAKDDLCYLLLYESAPGVTAQIPKKGTSQVTVNSPIMKHTHEKILSVT